MSEEKLFDVNGVQSQWETPVETHPRDPVISGDNAEWQIRDICIAGGEGIEGE